MIRGLLLGMGTAFLLAFAALTLAALSTAELNFASILAFGFSFGVIALAVLAVIGAIRNPPDEDE